MSASVPGHLKIDGHCLIVLEKTLLASAPEEGCVLLLGRQAQTHLEIVSIWPCLNVWQPATERDHRFRLDPLEQLLAQRWSRARGLSVIGAAHSHPSSEAVPSATDRQLSTGPSLMVILSGLQHDLGLGALRAWWMPESDGNGLPPEAPTELRIHLEPAAPSSERLGE